MWDDLIEATNRIIESRDQSHSENYADYFVPFSEDLIDGKSVILCCRVSGREQKRGHNPEDQERHYRQIIEDAGGTVQSVYQHVGSGYDGDWLRMLHVAAREARETGADFLFFESVSRAIRNAGYHSRLFPNCQPDDWDLEELALRTWGVRLMSFVPPEASPGEIRSEETKRGQSAKRRKGGRPKTKRAGYKKLHRERWFEEVIRLYLEGYSVPNIVQQTSTPRRTVYNWLKESDIG